jgi:hypothetical protein
MDNIILFILDQEKCDLDPQLRQSQLPSLLPNPGHLFNLTRLIPANTN